MGTNKRIDVKIRIKYMEYNKYIEQTDKYKRKCIMFVLSDFILWLSRNVCPKSFKRGNVNLVLRPTHPTVKL